jgi:lipopolysaccharide transport system ATP-binding protein
MPKPAISVRGVSKRYHIGATLKHDTLRDHIAHAVRSITRIRPSTKPEPDADDVDADNFWALKDVSFDVQPGEIVGIIGRNGAGKSTLLKILSQITDPTEGEIRIRGRVASLLEVGTGFHPELTGRENIFLNGAILGMTRAEIAAKFDEIINFSGVEKFIDTPVKRYSSGMTVRLAFAVAAHLEPEILLVDEVLAVGDLQFQKKCLGKMQDVANQRGRTVIFVSHNMAAITTLTTRCLFLKHGKRVCVGPTAEVISAYLGESQLDNSSFNASPNPDRPNVTKIEVITDQPGQVQTMGQAIEFRFEIWTPNPINNACFSFQIVNENLQPVVHQWTFDSERPFCRAEGRYQLICRIDDFRLYIGRYTLTTYLAEPPGGESFGSLENVCAFEVAALNSEREFQWQRGACAYLERSEWSVTAM